MAPTTAQIRKFIRRLSKGGGATVDEIRHEAEQFCQGASDKERRSLGKGFLEAACAHANDGGHVRARTAVIACLSCDASLRTLVEKRPLLYDPSLGRHPRLELVDLLAREGPAPLDTVSPGFGARLQTFRNLALAQNDLAPAFDEYRALLRARPPYLLKALIACADIAFLLRSLPEDQAQSLLSHLPAVKADSPEEIAEVVSRVIAEASELAPVEHDDLNAEVAEGLRDPRLELVLRIGAARCALGEFQKSTVILGYEVVRDDEATYTLRPPDMEFERRLRISHATGELARRTGGLHLSRRFAGAMLLHDFAKLYARRLGDRSIKVAERPFPRVVVSLPLAEYASRLFLERGNFLDDVMEMTLHEDLQLHGVDLQEAVLSSSLTVGRYLELFRLFRLQTALHTALVLRGAQGAAHLIVNSLLPVLTREQLAGVLYNAEGEATPENVDAFIDALTWPPPKSLRRGGGTEHLELQYTPLLQIRGQYLLAPRLVLNANALRNTFSAQRARIPTAGDAFTRAVAELLRKVFPHVAVERKYDIQGLSGDVDVVVLHGAVLYLFECKHSLPAATTHEHRDLLEDVKTGAAQLLRAQQALPLDPALRNRLKQWFPDAEIGALNEWRYVPCVVTATRMFSGIELTGIPVRDIFSLENVLLRGSLEIIAAGAGDLMLRQYSFWRGEKFSPDDLEDYLRIGGLYWQTRGVHSVDLAVLEARVPPGVSLVTETCRVTFESWEESVSRLDALGLRVVEERREPRASPTPDLAEDAGSRAQGDTADVSHGGGAPEPASRPGAGAE